MVTARTAFGTSRTRYTAGPLRLLWLAALLFAFLYTHAAGADSASAHVTGGAVDVSYPTPTGHGNAHDHDTEAPDEPDGGSGHSHPAEACASGHPQQGLDLPNPQLTALARLTPAVGAMKPQPWVGTIPSGLPPLRSSLGSVVQQV
ncbi:MULTISPECIES: hypothetical protein [unclassified Streptomyces]|uniref:hypothetical protein n=1 Tax=unclassified Streptomyces TaxID=2593676 RepID=UPI000DC755F8|nr:MULTISPECIES: hypothetical protein [unclassified Streptomyces]AWZ07810.1 hypothetical protein DRB89_27940 [Streptomyces sp. ICC4]AWZ16685.1 hypothetical protein DRB96_35870 [Streptomyces sp. ICC1]